MQLADFEPRMTQKEAAQNFFSAKPEGKKNWEEMFRNG